MNNDKKPVSCIGEQREKRTLHSVLETPTESENRKTILGRHVSFMGLFHYHDKLEPISSEENIKILQNETTLNKNLGALLYKGALGDTSALADLKTLESETLGITPPMLFQEVLLLDDGSDKIQVLTHRVSLHRGNFQTDEANEMRQSLHKHEIGGQFLSLAMDKLNQDKANKNTVVAFKPT